MNFNELVALGLTEGLTRAEAEARAREICYGEGAPEDQSFLNDVDEALWRSCGGLSPKSRGGLTPPSGSGLAAGFSSVEELWSNLQAAWGQRGRGVELTDILEEINELLDRGVISGEQFAELLSRSHANSLAQPAAKKKLSPSRAADKPRRLAQPPLFTPPAPALPPPPPSSGDVNAARRLQAAFRGRRGRERFAWAVRERARILRDEQREAMRARALAAEDRKWQRQLAAVRLQAMGRRLIARRSLRAAVEAATRVQAAERAQRARASARAQRAVRVRVVEAAERAEAVAMAAVVVQAAARAAVARAVVSAARLERSRRGNAVSRVQAASRALRARRQLGAARRAATSLQSHARALAARAARSAAVARREAEWEAAARDAVSSIKRDLAAHSV